MYKRVKSGSPNATPSKLQIRDLESREAILITWSAENWSETTEIVDQTWKNLPHYDAPTADLVTSRQETLQEWNVSRYVQHRKQVGLQ